MRPEIEGAKRVVVKVGSSSLTDARGQLDPARITQLAELLARQAEIDHRHAIFYLRIV